MNNRLRRIFTPYMFIAPCLILLGAILVYPLFSGLISTLYNTNLMVPVPPRFIGLDNFSRLLADNIFWHALKNSMVWTVGVVLIQFVFGFSIALLLNQDIKGRRIFRSLILIPWVIPAAVGAVTWRWIYAEQYGILNHILYSLNIIPEYVAWLSDPSLALKAAMAVAIWKQVPFVAIVLLAGLQSISHTLYEAGRVDGANTGQLFLHITIPQLKNIIFILLLLTSIWTFNQFETVNILTRGGPGNSSLIMPVYTYRLFQSFDISYAASSATIMLLILMVLAYFYVKQLLEN